MFDITCTSPASWACSCTWAASAPSEFCALDLEDLDPVLLKHPVGNYISPVGDYHTRCNSQRVRAVVPLVPRCRNRISSAGLDEADRFQTEDLFQTITRL